MNQRSTNPQLQPQRPSFFTPITERFSYDRLNRLGGGTYGTVYLGRDKEAGDVAVKIIQRSNLYRVKWEGTELVEVNMLRSLSGKHPNMLRFLACVGSRLTTQVFIFTELCEKGALTKLITKLTELQTFLLFKQLVEGMEFLHQLDIIHHDLKPDNILVTGKDQLKIADFGSARWSDTGVLKSMPKYTPFYASPQVFLAEDFDKKCDVFSAGYVLYQMLTGQRLNKQVKNINTFLQKHRTTGFNIGHPAISCRWEEVIRSMLQFDPEKRPSFSQLRAVMSDFEAPLDRLPPSLSPSMIEAEESSRHLQAIINHVRRMEAHNNYLILILRVFKQFEREKSLLVPRVYKIILLYLSINLYCLISEDTLIQLEHTPALIIGTQSVQEIEDTLTVQDRAKLATFLREARRRINLGKEQMKDYIRKKIMIDIKEGNNQSEFRVLDEMQISEGVRQLEQGEPGVAPFYRQTMARCINNLYQTAEELESRSDGDLACYLTILYVRQVALDLEQTSFLPPALSTILKLSRNQLLSEISRRKSR